MSVSLSVCQSVILSVCQSVSLSVCLSLSVSHLFYLHILIVLKGLGGENWRMGTRGGDKIHESKFKQKKGGSVLWELTQGVGAGMTGYGGVGK